MKHDSRLGANLVNKQNSACVLGITIVTPSGVPKPEV